MTEINKARELMIQELNSASQEVNRLLGDTLRLLGRQQYLMELLLSGMVAEGQSLSSANIRLQKQLDSYIKSAAERPLQGSSRDVKG